MPCLRRPEAKRTGRRNTYDENASERGNKISDADLAAVTFHADTFHGEWNYLIKPTT